MTAIRRGVKRRGRAVLFAIGDLISRVLAWNAERDAKRYGGWERMPADHYDRWRWTNPLAWLYQTTMRYGWPED